MTITYLSCFGLSLLSAEVEPFLDSYLDKQLYPPVYRILQEAQARGAWTAILSTSPWFLVGPLAQRLHIKMFQATEYKIDKNGTLEEIQQVLLGQDKARHAQEYAQQCGVALSDVAAYSDSHDDAPLLLSVGQPVAVRPDHRLRQLCLQKGWPIL